MIETYRLSHNGGQDKHCDDVLVRVGKVLWLVVVQGSKEITATRIFADAFQKVFATCADDSAFTDLCEKYEKLVPHIFDYMIMKVSDSELSVFRHGSVKGYLVRNGEIKLLPNGTISANDEDRILVATQTLYEKITPEGILADGLMATNCEEWMNYMLYRVSSLDMLSGPNLTAVTIMVRFDEAMKLYTISSKKIEE